VSAAGKCAMPAPATARPALQNIQAEIARLGWFCERTAGWARAERELLNLDESARLTAVARGFSRRAFELAQSLPLHGR
jgi:hypothetical protein